MPIFDYECHKCGTITESLQKYDEAGPVCCDEEMHRLIGTPAFQFDNPRGTDMGMAMSIRGHRLPPDGIHNPNLMKKLGPKNG